MKRIVTLLLVLAVYLNAESFWTLTGLEKANVYVKNDISLLQDSTITTIKQKINTMLKNEGIKTKQQDSPTLMLALEEIEDDVNHYVYVRLALGEEVQTFRKDKPTTFALTYFINDFVSANEDELDSAVLESVDFLLSQFVEHFRDDKE